MTEMSFTNDDSRTTADGSTSRVRVGILGFSVSRLTSGSRYKCSSLSQGVYRQQTSISAAPTLRKDCLKYVCELLYIPTLLPNSYGDPGVNTCLYSSTRPFLFYKDVSHKKIFGSFDMSSRKIVRFRVSTVISKRDNK